MKERRRLKRRHLSYSLRVFDRNTDELFGHLVDITSEGVMFISENPIEEEVTFHLKMTLPPEFSGGNQLEFSARCMWCRKDVNPDFYATGFQLIDVSKDHFAIVERLIEEFGFRD